MQKEEDSYMVAENESIVLGRTVFNKIRESFTVLERKALDDFLEGLTREFCEAQMLRNPHTHHLFSQRTAKEMFIDS